MFVFIFPLNAQVVNTEIPIRTPGEIPGDSDVADRYVEWVLRIIDEGRWDEALNALERARDFSSVSSDISYLLALARNRSGQPLGAVLQVLDEALGAARWRKCPPEEARYLKAEILLRLKRYPEILPLLDTLPETLKTANLKLKTLRFYPAHEQFRIFAAETLDLYPRESEPVRIFLDFIKSEYARGRLPQSGDTELLETIFRRLPVLLESDPCMAWMAAPFMRDTAEARRLVSAYRAVNKPDPFSLPAALNLGVIDEETAVEEFFSNSQITNSGMDRNLLEELYGLMRDEPRREFFRGNLLRYSGVIREDTDGDGFYEMSALYSQGMLVFCSFDSDQDGIPELEIEFEAGEPKTASVPALPEAGRNEGQRPPAYPLRKTDRQRVFANWERYPAVLEARMGNEYYFLRPLELVFAPVQFIPLAGTGLLFPEAVPGGLSVGRRSLIVHSLRVERPSREFPGALEVVELNQGIPVRAREYLEGRLISETNFLRGRPLSQRVDLDMDGRLETLRHFRRFPLGMDGVLPPLEGLLDYVYDFDYAESDWDGDGIFERRQYD